jgi:serine/threonine-protein kinase
MAMRWASWASGVFAVVAAACGSDGGAGPTGTSSGGSSGTSGTSGASSGGSSGTSGTSGASSGGSSGTSGTSGSSGDGGASPDGSTAGGGGLFPPSSIFYQDISGAPVDGAWSTIRAAVDALGGFGTGAIQINFEFHVLHADASVVPRPFTQDPTNFFVGECDTAPIPVPPGGAMEAVNTYACNVANNDCHLVVVQGNRLYEGWRANIAGGTATGSPFTSGCVAIWDLTKDYWQPVSGGAVYSRGDHCGSADAGGFPIAAMLFSADEVSSGEIKHAIRFIMPNDRIRKDVYVHPAVHAAGSGATDVLPYGARLRLKATADLSTLKPWAKIVAKAMQKYGMFLSDGGNQALTAQSDKFTTAKWGTNLTQNDLGALKFDDFEMIDGGSRIPKSGNCPHVVVTK